jgi:hypothetical protein
LNEYLNQGRYELAQSVEEDQKEDKEDDKHSTYPPLVRIATSEARTTQASETKALAYTKKSNIVILSSSLSSFNHCQ